MVGMCNNFCCDAYTQYTHEPIEIKMLHIASIEMIPASDKTDKIKNLINFLWYVWTVNVEDVSLSCEPKTL